MKTYRILIEQDEDWYAGTVIGERTLSTQGRTLDELVFMVRDAIELAWEETDVHLELVVTPDVDFADRNGSWGKTVAT